MPGSTAGAVYEAVKELGILKALRGRSNHCRDKILSSPAAPCSKVARRLFIGRIDPSSKGGDRVFSASFPIHVIPIALGIFFVVLGLMGCGLFPFSLFGL